MGDNAMSREAAEEYTAALGQVFGGGYGLVLTAHRLGVPAALGMSTEEWVRERLGGYIRMSVPERREATAELAAQGMKQREIAGILGVTPMTVSRDLRGHDETNVTAAPENEADRAVEQNGIVTTVASDREDDDAAGARRLVVVDQETGEIVGPDLPDSLPRARADREAQAIADLVEEFPEEAAALAGGIARARLPHMVLQDLIECYRQARKAQHRLEQFPVETLRQLAAERADMRAAVEEGIAVGDGLAGVCRRALPAATPALRRLP